ncbi:MAG: hypothetical protein OEW98_03190 [Betaproteobacteria bacterium]|jgi:hypothetical protein|nr:hypothetical protein [Betaproteobacteria bacterium]
MQAEDRNRNPSRNTVDDVVFSITLSIFAASLAVLVASALTEGSASITLAASEQDISQRAVIAAGVREPRWTASAMVTG